MKTISVDEADQAAGMLVVRYQQRADDPVLMSVQITSQVVECTAGHVERSEVALICAEEKMTVSDIQARVEAEGEARNIACVAWIDGGTHER
jgi:hypothetical protein